MEQQARDGDHCRVHSPIERGGRCASWIWPRARFVAAGHGVCVDGHCNDTEAERIAAHLRAKGFDAELQDRYDDEMFKEMPSKLMRQVTKWLQKKDQENGVRWYAVVFEDIDMKTALTTDLVDAFQFDSFRVEGTKTIPLAEVDAKHTVLTFQIYGEFLNRIKRVKWKQVPKEARWLLYFDLGTWQVRVSGRVSK